MLRFYSDSCLKLILEVEIICQIVERVIKEVKK